MKNDSVRIFAFKNPELVRCLIVTQNQIKIIKYINTKLGAVSLDVSVRFKISIQSASTILATLYKKGYLTRKEKVHISGGIQFIYAVRNRFVLL